MADVMLPPWLKIARVQTSYLDNTGMTRALYTAAPETTGFGGDRLKLSLEFTPTSSTQSAVERAALRTFLARLRGRQNRAYLWDPSYRGPRGAFKNFTGELLPNNTFENDTTGWVAGADASLSVQDRVLRVTRIANATAGAAYAQAPSVTTVQYAPYVWRVFVSSVRGTVNAGASIGGNSIPISGNDTAATPGYRKATFLATATSGVSLFADNIGALVSAAGDFYEVSYTSLSRCALVDNGLNLLLRSDEFDNAAWTKNGATIPSAVTDPQGGATADFLREDSANSAHEANQAVTVSSAAGDYALSVAVRSNGRNFVRLIIAEATGGTAISQFFNLSTGAVGVTGSTGANWANRRSPTPVNLGNGWYVCTLVGRKTNAATSLTAAVQIASADTSGGETYLGNGTDGIAVWRGTAAPSSVPTRLVQTTTTASTGTNQTGSALYVKGGRVPGEGALAGALLPDDRFEIRTSRGSEMKIVTAPLDFDAAGLGYLQFEPPLMGIPADNAPIIVVNPMTRAIFVGDVVAFDDTPGVITTAAADFEEAA